MINYLEQLAELYRFKFGTIPCIFVLILALILALYIWSHLVYPLLFS
jgi:dolichol-phosphate mannosyltransferase